MNGDAASCGFWAYGSLMGNLAPYGMQWSDLYGSSDSLLEAAFIKTNEAKK
jgi:hypothetical protein